jgi:hypothetical protein
MCLLSQALEAVEVELVGLELQDVTGRAGDERLLGGPVRASEQLAQPGDVAVQRRRGGLRWLLAPELLDQPVAGDDLVRVQQEESEKGAALPSAELEGSAAIPNLEWAEQPELQGVTSFAPTLTRPLAG